MPAGGARALNSGDPCLLWLEFHGAVHGFTKDRTDYDWLVWIADKARGFESAWASAYFPAAEMVVKIELQGQERSTVEETLRLLESGAPALCKAPLWDAEFKVFGVPDFIIKNTELYRLFPQLAPAQPEPDHYVAVDCKFTTRLDSNSKSVDLEIARTQLRIYTFIIGRMQGYMPPRAFVVTRDRIDNPMPIDTQIEGEALPADLAALRDDYLRIKLGGAEMLPWKDPQVAPDFNNKADQPWHGAKTKIRDEYWPGGGPIVLLPRINKTNAVTLAGLGISTLQDAIDQIRTIEQLTAIKGIGPGTAPTILAMIEAKRSGRPSPVPLNALPPKRKNEIYVDLEYFTNVNVDFVEDWPALVGTEMVFMIGIGREVNGEFEFESMEAPAETHDSEKQLWARFLDWLSSIGICLDPAETALYHWSNAEQTQASASFNRHGIEELKNLPWVDLRENWVGAGIALPGAFDNGLKTVAKALSNVAPEYKVEWPDDLDIGLAAMVAGWRAYESADPLRSKEMAVLRRYLEIDVKATWQVLRWMRSVAQ